MYGHFFNFDYLCTKPSKMSKVVLITGATSGIGQAIALYLHQKGYTVYGTGRKPENSAPQPFQLLALDVRKEETIQEAVQTLLAKEKRIDVLINNAGVGITGPLEEMPLEEIKNNFDTNLFGPIQVIKAVLPQMRQQKTGLIINVTSIAGYMGLPFRSAYSSSKGALELITESLRMEVKSFGIQVTNVAPGDFSTNIASRRYHAPVLEGSPYQQVYQQQLDTIDADVDSGMSPEAMAKAIHQIIETKNPKVHYKVGAFLQKLSIVLKRILPSKVYEKILMNHYNLK